MCHPDLTMPVSGGDGTTFEQIVVPGEGIGLPCYLARPAETNAPAVLIIHDVHGANAFYQDLARRLAGEGFNALLPDFFVRQGPPTDSTREAVMERAKLLDQLVALEDIAHVVTWLGSEISSQIAVLGFCMGGTFALLAAGRSPLPSAAVAYYGFPQGRQGWQHVPTDEVGQLRSPVLALWGDQDHGVGMDNVAAWQQAADAAEKDVDIVIYPGLPHGFLTFDPDSPNYEGAQDSWTRTLTFLREKLAA